MLTKSKNGFYAFPAIASLILPGLGQLFKGQIGKGLVFMAILFGWGYLTFVPNLLPLGPLVTWLIGAAAWLINVLDAGFNSVGQRY